MKNFITQIIKIIIFLTFAISASGEILPFGWSPLDFNYDIIERTESNDSTIFDFQIGLYNQLNKPLPATSLSSFIHPKDESISLFGSFSQFISARDGKDSDAFESLRAGFSAKPFDKLHLFGLFRLDEALTKDSTYTGKKWRGLAGSIDQAFIHYESKSFRIIAGRFSNFWGVRKSQIFSSSRSLDGLEYTVKWGRLSLSYRIARLDENHVYTDSSDYIENRYVAAHRLDLHLKNNLRIGFFETAVFGGLGRTVDFYYLNPILFYHGDQLNGQYDDNTFLGFDFNYSPLSVIKTYGQLMVDDFQLDSDEAGDNEPGQYALHLGIFWSELSKSLDLRFEYSRVTNWTFNQPLDRNRYLYNSKPIGDVMGNDYDQLTTTLRYWWNNKIFSGLRFEHKREGEGTIESDWTAPWLAIGADYKERFPSGIVEYSTTIAATVKGFIAKSIFLDCEAGYRSIKNEHNLCGLKNSFPFIELRLTGFLVNQLDISR